MSPTDIILDIPNAEKVHEVSRKVLPLHCPLPGDSLWNSHPKVYIPLKDGEPAKCPYCGCEYRLVD